MDTQRQLKIARLLQKELGEIFRVEGQNMKGALITVTQVRVTKDLSLARIYLSLFAVRNKVEVFEQLKLKNKDFRHQLAVKVKNQIRAIPVLEFFLDDSLDYLENIENLLNQ